MIFGGSVVHLVQPSIKITSTFLLIEYCHDSVLRNSLMKTVRTKTRQEALLRKLMKLVILSWIS
jgi:hypothetical protein